MSPSENEEEKKISHDPDPLCLFYFPQYEVDGSENQCETYLSSTRGYEPTKTQKLAEGQRPTRVSPWKLPPARRVQERILSSSDDAAEQARTLRSEAVSQKHKNRYAGRKTRETYQQRKGKVRRFGKEPVHHLTSYLLSSVQTASVPVGDQLPPLNNVLETITHAWPESDNLQLYGQQATAMAEVEPHHPATAEVPLHVLARRRSVPEEIIRQFSVQKERTSESEANITMPEITSPSSKENEEFQDREPLKKNEELRGVDKLRSEAFSLKIEDDTFYAPSSQLSQRTLRRFGRAESFRLVEDHEIVRSAEEGSSDSDSDAPGMERFNTIKRAPLRRGSVIEGSVIESTDTPNPATERASQNDYYRNGQGILKIAAAEKSSQTGECTCRSLHDSGTTPSAREESESGETSDSISSPRLCTQPLSSSENQSSDSEGIKCTCAEVTSSKETSTDPNHSGKSTLSQTVSDKSTSTQDSTASINSVSSRGSSISVATDSSSTEVDPRTSAKETTSPDHSPRSPPGRRGQDRDRDRTDNEKKGGRSQDNLHRQCPHHKNDHKGGGQNRNIGASKRKTQKDGPTEKLKKNCEVQTSSPPPQTPLVTQKPRLYEWAQLSEEELCLVQQQRHKKFIENNRNFESPVIPQATPTVGKIHNLQGVSSTTGSSYQETEYTKGLPLMVPRYSALPRTMSMVVNSSSFEASHHSDSDSQSLADSLEDGQNCKEHNYFDTKQEQKPVRGDIEQALAERNKKSRQKEPSGRAYFFAIDDDGGAQLVTNIHKIPELPNEIKHKIHKRHISICKNHSEKEVLKPPRIIDRRHRLVKKKLKANKGEEQRQETQRQPAQNTSTPPKSRLNELTTPIKVKEKKPINDTAKKGNVPPKLLSKIPTPIPIDSPDRKKVILESPIDKPKPTVIQSKTPKTPKTPQAVIHPFQSSPAKDPASKATPQIIQVPPSVDLEAITRHRLSLISSLESTASALKAQQTHNQKPPINQQQPQRQWNRPQPAAKRTSKFQQRFEVIPEERSSSLTSSAEEHNRADRRLSLPVKLEETAMSPTFLTGDAGGKSFRRYSLGSLSNHVIAKLIGRPLQAIPCVQRGPNNENQQIIIFSPKDTPGPNSSKGRDALLAMNRQDFNRLSKGWMNFYLLKESSDEELDDCIKKEGEGKVNQGVNKIIDENKAPSDPNTLVCRIPSMEKDPPTTSGSGTDDTCTPPGQFAPPLPFDFTQLNKSYSLLLKNAETNCFQLHECPVDHDNTKNEDGENSKDLKRTNKNNLSFISEEPELIDEGIFVSEASPVDESRKEQKNVSTEVDAIISELKKVAPQKILTKEASTSTEKKEHKKRNEPPIQLSAPLKLGSSNTVLTTKKPIKISPRKTPKSSGRSCSLPELNMDQAKKQTPLKTQSLVDSLPRLPGASSDSDMDSDSTVYLDAPSPEVPRLPLEGCCDYSSDSSSSSSENVRVNAVPLSRERQYAPLRRRPLPFRPKNRFSFADSGKKPGNSGWSVTVEGTLAFPRTRPDVQMRLSFPNETGPPIVSQSDSGFVEDREAKTNQQKQQWTVTVKNPQTGNGKEKHKAVCQLPNLSQHQLDRNTKRGSKEITVNDDTGKKRKEIETKLSRIWPKVQEIIEKELKTITGEMMDNDTQRDDEPLLSVEGRAVSFDTKPRLPKMSERDLTRNNTARSDKLKGATVRQKPKEIKLIS